MTYLVKQLRRSKTADAYYTAFRSVMKYQLRLKNV